MKNGLHYMVLYDVIIHYVNSREAAENISKDIEEKYGVKTAVIKADLSKEDEVRELAAKAFEVFEKVDVLVNNAESAEYDASKAALIRLPKHVRDVWQKSLKSMVGIS